ncbi:MAG: hypothetical protein H5T86_11460, partial [Armatimonadetes bacterium]|nr:hypothetical protein [Armatimonadota bacterium]
MQRLTTVLVVTCLAATCVASTYYVDQAHPSASDTNPGTETAPWKTIARAGKAGELRPGDIVVIKSGVYREWVDIKVSGEPGKPITFQAAPGARVVIKGSELVRGPYKRLGDLGILGVEPFPFAFRRVWAVKLGEEFFTDPRFPGCYDDKSRRWVSQVFWQDDHPLQMIGPDPIYPPDVFDRRQIIGKGLADMIPQSFWFDPKDSTLYLNIGGEPVWYSIEVGVR